MPQVHMTHPDRGWQVTVNEADTARWFARGYREDAKPKQAKVTKPEPDGEPEHSDT